MSQKGFSKRNIVVLTLILSLFSTFSFASSPEHSGAVAAEESKFNVKEVTMHHLLDAYEWEFFKDNEGNTYKLSLPRIIYNGDKGGFDFFASTEAALAAGYGDAHHYDAENAKHGDVLLPGYAEKLHHLQAEIDNAGAEDKAGLEAEYKETLSHAKPLDFSITKNVLFMFIASVILLLVFISVAGAYKRREGQSPKGMQSFFEPIILFVRDDIAKENIPNKYEKFTPLLLTLFFFIWFLNMMGMMPFSSNVTGNISVTLALSLITLIVVNIYANKAYWKHIFWPPVPHGVKVIMVPLEIVSIFTKPFALTIRLFANITGGHVIVISLLSLIFIFGEMGRNAVAGWGVGIFSSLFLVAISCLELFVALLQAYVFTMLTAVFIGSAVAEDEHH